MKKFLTLVGIFFERLKSFLIAIIVICAIMIALMSIVHNVLKIRELYIEDTSEYKNTVKINENLMNVQVSGTGEKTIVILSDFATVSPIIEYKTYVDKLSSHYRVVVIEYFGYGFSLSSETERTNNVIANEIKLALQQVGIEGKYTILANGISSLYACAYANTYADEVEKLILVDGVYPATIQEKHIKELVENEKKNSIITSYAELTGYARVLSYIKPEFFGIDKMNEHKFNKSDISLYRKMIANKYYTSTMINEIKKKTENMETLKYYQFSEYLPVTQILSKEYVDEYQKYKKDKLIEKDIEEYANDLITNSEIQNTIIVNGNKRLNLNNPDAVINQIISE